MSNIIHGLSHKALKYMRKRPATLAVYWIYISRTNHENVAWPSIRGLERDTAWNRTTCQEARAWLVEHQALERVSDYIRPEWRGLDEKELKQKRNLDRAEYYRPTGHIVIDGEVFPMLYFGKSEVSDIESSDVLPRRTPMASDTDGVGHRQDQTKLDSILEPDTKEKERECATEPAAQPEPAAKDEPLSPSNIVEFPEGPDIAPEVYRGLGMPGLAAKAEKAQSKKQAKLKRDAVYTHPLWQAFRNEWPENARPIVSPRSVDQFAEVIELLEEAGVTPVRVAALARKRLDAGKTGYSFLFVPEDIHEIPLSGEEPKRVSKPRGIWSQAAPDTAPKSNLTPEERAALVANGRAAKAAAMREANAEKKVG